VLWLLTMVVLALVVAAGLLVRDWQRRRQRKRYPKDYAYVVYRGARGKDLFAAMGRRLPGLTQAKYEALLAEFTAVDMSIRALAGRSGGQRPSTSYLREALRQLHPFLTHEGLERAVRAARRRAKKLQSGERKGSVARGRK